MKRRLGTVLALALAAGLIGLGLARGQTQQVLMTALYVCLECIGIG